MDITFKILRELQISKRWGSRFGITAAEAGKEMKSCLILRVKAGSNEQVYHFQQDGFLKTEVHPAYSK
jgi:hypothetical protein